MNKVLMRILKATIIMVITVMPFTGVLYAKNYECGYPVLVNNNIKFFVNKHNIISYDNKNKNKFNEDYCNLKEQFKIYTINKQIGTATIKKINHIKTEEQEMLSKPVYLEMNEKYFTKTSAQNKIYLSSPWNPLPKNGKLKVLVPNNLIYKKIVSTQLKLQKHINISSAKVKINQLLRGDLDNDGQEEVLISCGSKSGYSMVLYRDPIGNTGKVKDIILNYNMNKDSFNGVLNVISNVIDINGDGKMEVIINSQIVEGGTYSIYSSQNNFNKPIFEFSAF